MKKRMMALTMTVIMILMLAACSGGKSDDGKEGGDEKEVKYHLGYLAWSLSDVWNANGNAAFVWAAEKMDCTVETMDCQKDPETQVSQAQEMINKGVDAIGLYPCTPEVGATIVRMANEADIPIAVENMFLPTDGSAGETIGQVAAVYEDVGYAAIEYIAENIPDAKILYVHGGVGVGVYESYQIGVDKALEKYRGKVEMAGLVDGNWETETAYNVTTDFISSGKSEFNVVFANNDQEAKGVYQALTENNMTDIPIVSAGGSDAGYDMLKEGHELANMTVPVNIESMILYRFLWDHLNGKTIEESKTVAPIIPISQENLDEWVLWSDNDAAWDYIGGIE